MTDLPQPWSAYRRLQQALDGRAQVNHDTWGLEAGLNAMADGANLSDNEVERTIRSASRKERHRARLRRYRLAIHDSPSTINYAAMIDSRDMLTGIAQSVSALDWCVLRALGEGQDYATIAKALNMTAGALRVRVLRLRRGLHRPAA